MGRKTKQVAGVFEKNPGSGIWYIRYRAAGTLVRKRIGSKVAAVDAINKVKYIRSSGEGVLAKSAKKPSFTQEELSRKNIVGVTVSQLCADYLMWMQDEANPRRPSDRINPRQRLQVVQDAFGERPAESLLPYEIEDWLRSLGRKPGTLNRYKSTFSSVYTYAKSRRKVTVNPVRDVQHFRVVNSLPRWLELAEEEKLRSVLGDWIETCPDHHQLRKLFLRCHPLELTVALGTGMRKGNQYDLRWDQLSFELRQIYLPTTKTGKPLTLPMIDDVYDALLELREIQAEIDAIRKSNPTEAIRMASNGRVFNISENREWWNAALKEAKISNFRWHDLRHTFASRLAQAGANMKVIQEACGHASISMTARYAHLNQAVLKDAMSVLNRRKAA